MGMSPKEFWQCSPQEVYMALDGFSEFNSPSDKQSPMNKNRLQEMMELYPD